MCGSAACGRHVVGRGAARVALPVHHRPGGERGTTVRHLVPSRPGVHGRVLREPNATRLSLPSPPLLCTGSFAAAVLRCFFSRIAHHPRSLRSCSQHHSIVRCGTSWVQPLRPRPAHSTTCTYAASRFACHAHTPRDDPLFASQHPAHEHKAWLTIETVVWSKPSPFFALFFCALLLR